MSKQSAVEWLANELYEKFEMKGDGALFNDLYNQAKEMEKQQIIDAYDVKVKHSIEQGTTVYTRTFGEQYYNETFKGQMYVDATPNNIDRGPR